MRAAPRVDAGRSSGTLAAPPGATVPAGLAGASPAMRDLAQQVEALVNADTSVLVTGEVGTGKASVAAYIHARSRRATRPFAAVRCAGGTPPGGGAPPVGPIDAAGRDLTTWAAGGALFLDEVAALDAPAQDALSAVLRSLRAPAGGAGGAGGVDGVRLMASTARDLVTEVTDGRFREDLYYHLSAMPVYLPPLRARTADDLAALVARVMHELAAEIPDAPASADDDAIAWLVQYPWPGNVRELRSVLERALLAARGAPAVTSVHLPPDLRPGASTSERHLPRTLEQVQRTHIERTLRVHQHNRTRAARELGISRATLIKKIKEYGLRS